MGATIDLTDGTGSVYGNGEAVSFTASADEDAWLLVFDIDTDGVVHLLYPRNQNSLRKTPAGSSLVIPQQVDESLLVTGNTGMEFVFAIAVRDRDMISEREMDWLYHDESLPVAEKFRVKGDPFLAANRIASRLIAGIAYSRDVSLAYTFFFVNEAVDYPRYLCEDCYKTGSDPYQPDREWVATAALRKADNLRYPLARAFQQDLLSDRSAAGDMTLAARGDGAEVQYYPTFDNGDNGSTVRVAIDVGYPFYSGWGYYPYYPYGSSWYFGIGWNSGWGYRGWGWGSCSPYYYNGCGYWGGYGYWGGFCGPYYGSPYRYKNGYHDYYSVASRSVRATAPGRRYKSASPSTSTRYASDGTRTRYRSYGTSPEQYASKSRRSYTPRREYAGKSASRESYRSKVRSIYRPRESTYGTHSYKRGYSNDKSIYRPRSSTNLTKGYTGRVRSGVTKSFSGVRSTRTRSSSPTVRSRGSIGGSHRSFTKGRASTHSYTGHSRSRSSSSHRVRTKSR